MASVPAIKCHSWPDSFQVVSLARLARRRRRVHIMPSLGRGASALHVLRSQLASVGCPGAILAMKPQALSHCNRNRAVRARLTPAITSHPLADVWTSQKAAPVTFLQVLASLGR